MAVSVVKAPLDAVDEPIAVPSIFPPLISVVVRVEVPVAVRSVKVPAAEEFAPIVVPSIAPPFISTAVLLVPTKDLKVEMLFVLVEILV